MVDKSNSCKYINQIVKANITPQQKGECLQESKKCTYGYMKVLIKYFENLLIGLKIINFYLKYIKY